MNEENIRIQDILDALKKRWQLIVGITLVATILATIFSFFVIKPKYQASAKLFIGKESTAESNNSDIQMYQQLIKTYTTVITTNDLVDRALNKKGIDLKSEEVLSELSVVPGAGTQVLEIKYVSKDKEQSRSVVEAIASEFEVYSKELITNADVKVIEKVRLPENPISPNKKLNIAIALLLGVMIGVGLALLLEFMDSTFKDKDALENTMGIPVIGVIPDTEKVK
ncbi:YveK family protein [Clostridium paraputrificum]|uniref:YveK family protein n=1 Tax=Clostridium paraputrificum TaxID=29363 RepID=UPI003D343A31